MLHDFVCKIFAKQLQQHRKYMNDEMIISNPSGWLWLWLSVWMESIGPMTSTHAMVEYTEWHDVNPLTLQRRLLFLLFEGIKYIFYLKYIDL